jgi:hypothetical protein
MAAVMHDDARSVSKPYLISVLALTIVVPAISIAAELLLHKDESLSLAVAGKWFIFWAVGVRLAMAGIRQIFNPAFTAKEIFHIDHAPSHAIVRELGFANLCAGLVGLISLFLPPWRLISAFSSGLYYGIAGAYHAIKNPAGANETIALISDIFIFVALAIYFVEMFAA